MLVADDKIKVVIVQPYQQSAEPPAREELFMNIGSVSGEEDEDRARRWGTTAPDEAVDTESGVKREMSFDAANKSVIEGDAE